MTEEPPTQLEWCGCVMARPGKPGCNGRELCKERRLQFNRHEGAEETDAVLLKRVESEQITRGPERTSLGHGAAALREAALARCDLRPRDGDCSPGMPCGLRGWFCSRRPHVRGAQGWQGAATPTALTAAGLFVLKYSGLVLLACDQSHTSCCCEPDNFFTMPQRLFLYKT